MRNPSDGDLDSIRSIEYEPRTNRSLRAEVLRLEELRMREDLDHSPYLPHRPNFFMTVTILDGNGSYMVDGEDLPCQRGSVFLIAPGQVIAHAPEASIRGHLIVCSKDAIDACQLLSGTNTSSLFDYRLRDSASLLAEDQVRQLQMLTELMLEEQSAPSRLMQEDALLHLLGLWLIRASRFVYPEGQDIASSTWRRYEAFVGLLEKHRHTTRNASEYARMLGVSAKQLHRTVAAVVTRTPKQLIDEDMVREIKRRLLSSADSVQAIAIDLGFDEPSNLVKYFKKHVGTTPGKFRDVRNSPPTPPD